MPYIPIGSLAKLGGLARKPTKPRDPIEEADELLKGFTTSTDTTTPDAASDNDWLTEADALLGDLAPARPSVAKPTVTPLPTATESQAPRATARPGRFDRLAHADGAYVDEPHDITLPYEGPQTYTADARGAKDINLPNDPKTEETRFQSWYAERAKRLKLNPNPDDPKHFYDYRAAFRAGAEPDATGHWPSAFKKEGHPNLIINGVDTRTGKAMPQAPYAPGQEVAALGSRYQTQIRGLQQQYDALTRDHAAAKQDLETRAKAWDAEITTFEEQKRQHTINQQAFQTRVDAWKAAGRPAAGAEALNAEAHRLDGVTAAINGRADQLNQRKPNPAALTALTARIHGLADTLRRTTADADAAIEQAQRAGQDPFATVGPEATVDGLGYRPSETQSTPPGPRAPFEDVKTLPFAVGTYVGGKLRDLYARVVENPHKMESLLGLVAGHQDEDAPHQPGFVPQAEGPAGMAARFAFGMRDLGKPGEPPAAAPSDSPSGMGTFFAVAQRLAQPPKADKKRTPDPIVSPGALYQIASGKFFEQAVAAGFEAARAATDPGAAVGAQQQRIAEAVAAKIPADLPANIRDEVINAGVVAATTAMSVPQSAVGFADLASGGQVGKFAQDQLKFRPEEARRFLEDYYSPAQKAAFDKVANAKGVINKTIAALTNPSTIFINVVQSVPMMLAGSLVGRALSVGSLAARETAALGFSDELAGAIGEGVTSGAQTAAQVREGSDDGLLDPDQAHLMMLSGASTTAMGRLGNGLAAKLGVADVDTMLIAAAGSHAAKRGLVQRIVYGASSEALEEILQSYPEQVLQNKATGRPWDEGIDDNVVMGGLAGAVMGAGGNLLEGGDHHAATKEKTPQTRVFPRAEEDFESGFASVVPPVVQGPSPVSPVAARPGDSAGEDASGGPPSTPPSPVVPPAAPPAGTTPAGIPFLITKKMAAELRDRGYDAAAINAMTPEAAHAILAQPTATDPIAEADAILRDAETPVQQNASTPSYTPPDKPRSEWTEDEIAAHVIHTMQQEDDEEEAAGASAPSASSAPSTEREKPETPQPSDLNAQVEQLLTKATHYKPVQDDGSPSKGAPNFIKQGTPVGRGREGTYTFNLEDKTVTGVNEVEPGVYDIQYTHTSAVDHVARPGRVLIRTKPHQESAVSPVDNTGIPPTSRAAVSQPTRPALAPPPNAGTYSPKSAAQYTPEYQTARRSFQSRLTKLTNAKNWQGLIDLNEEVQRYHDDNDIPYPDDWRRWQGAADDARVALQREQPTHNARSRPAPPVDEESASPFTTPGTRLTWSSGQEWADHFREIHGRHISSTRHAQEAAHLDELAKHPAFIQAQSREDLDAIRDVLLDKEADLVPPKGARASTSYERVINEVNNAIARLEKPARGSETESRPPAGIDREGPPVHPGAKTANTEGAAKAATFDPHTEGWAILDKEKTRAPQREYPITKPLVEGEVKAFVRHRRQGQETLYTAVLGIRGRRIAEYETFDGEEAGRWVETMVAQYAKAEALSPRTTVKPADHKTLLSYLKALGYENIKKVRGGNLVARLTTRRGRRVKFTVSADGTTGAGVFGHNKSQEHTFEFRDFQGDVAKYFGQQPKEDTGAMEAPISEASLRVAFNLSAEQAEATNALVKAMGLDPSKIRVVKGGTPGDGALSQDDIIARARQLYRERGHHGRHSIVGMAQALKDAGYSFGPLRTAAQKRAANAFVDRVVAETEAPPSSMAEDSPFRLYQEPSAEPFYSRLHRAVDEARQPRGTGAQWKGIVKNAKGGINKDEYVFAHVDDLDDKTIYAKQEVLDYLKANEVRVQPVILKPYDFNLQDPIRNRALEVINFHGYAIEGDPLGEDPEVWLTKDGEPLDEKVRVYRAADLPENPHGLTDDDLNSVQVMRESPEWASVPDAVKEALAKINEQNRSEIDESTQYGDYTIPGQTVEGSYREVFLTVPAGKSDFDPTKVEIKHHLRSVTQGDISIWYDGKKLVQYNDDPKRGRDGVYRQQPDAHWRDVAKTIFHSGLDVLKLKPLTKVPTWQDGHDGYDGIANPIVRVRFNVRELHDTVSSFVGSDNSGTFIEFGPARVMFLEEVQPPQKQQQQYMPALLLKHWRELGVKWALRYAAENGLDGVAWTTGQMQADRYSLERAVKFIEWRPTAPIAEGWSHIDTATPQQETAHLARGVKGDLTSKESKTYVQVQFKEEDRALGFWIDANAKIIDTSTFSARNLLDKQLDEAVGKEIARQILDAPKGRLEGQGLKVGGEGLKRLYDVDLPAIINKIPAVKRSGEKVSTTDIAVRGMLSGEEDWKHISYDDMARAIGVRSLMDLGYQDPESGIIRPLAEIFLEDFEYTEAEIAQTIARRPASLLEDLVNNYSDDHFDQHLHILSGRISQDAKARVPVIAITPALREAVLGGQPLFQGPKGATEFSVDGKAIIRGLQAADVSTAVHEIAHVARRQLLNRNVPEDQRHGISVLDISHVEQWAGAVVSTDGKAALWDVAAEEKFARGFERYLRDGQAPTSQLAAIFAKFKTWLSTIYQQLTGSDIDVDITPAVRAVFDKLITRGTHVDSRSEAGADSARGAKSGEARPGSRGARAPGRETGRSDSDRAGTPRPDRVARATDGHWPDVLAAAQQAGYTGEVDTLRQIYDRRVTSVRDYLSERAAVLHEHGGYRLLEDIIKLGGIRPFEKNYVPGAPTTKLRGEFETMIENFRQQGIFGARSPFRTSGLGLDDLRDQLQQDGRWPEIADEEDLKRRVDELSRGVGLEAAEGIDDAEILHLLEAAGGVRGDETWWDDLLPDDALAANPTEEGDDTFDIDPATGELQARLPGAADARKVGKADTTFKAPQQASGDDFNLTPEGHAPEVPQGGLFDEPTTPPASRPAQSQPVQPKPPHYFNIDLPDDLTTLSDDELWALNADHHATTPAGALVQQGLIEAKQAKPYQARWDDNQRRLNEEFTRRRAAASTPKANNPWEMTLAQWRTDPRAQNVPRGSILASSLDDIKSGRAVAQASKTDLMSFAEVMGIPTSGTKDQLRTRITLAFEMRMKLSTATVAQLADLPRSTLLQMIYAAKKKRMSYLNRHALAATLLNWRDKTRHDGQLALAQATHEIHIAKALKAGLQVPAAVLKDHPGLKEEVLGTAPEVADEEPSADEPIVFRSGNTRSPADLEGYIKAEQPVGFVVTADYPVRARAAEYARKGGKVFVDSGAFGVEDPDFDAVFTGYNAFLDHVADANLSGTADAFSNVYVVAPDKVGDRDATLKLQQRYAPEIQALISRGVNVIVPVQMGNAPYDAGEIVRLFPDAIIGIPSNKAAASLEDLDAILREIVRAAGHAPAGIHFLGMGEKNARFESFVEKVREYFPTDTAITADSNRTRALMVPGRPAHTATQQRTWDFVRQLNEVSDEQALKMLRGAWDNAEFREAVFTPNEIADLEAAHDEDARTELLRGMANDRLGTHVRPGIRTQVIAEHDANPKKKARAALIERIVAAAHKPMDQIIPVVMGKGTDGQWYRARGNTLPIGVQWTDEKRTDGYVFLSRDGATYGTRYDSPAAAQAAFEKAQEKRDAEFRDAIKDDSDERLRAQNAHWIHEEDRRRLTLFVAKIKGRTRRNSVELVTGWFQEVGHIVAKLAQDDALTPELLQQALTVYDKGELAKAVKKYGFDGTLPGFTGQEAAAPPQANATVTRNTERGSIEVKFERKPSEIVRNNLKKGGFRWGKSTGTWYRKVRASEMGAIEELARGVAGLPKVEASAPAAPASRPAQSQPTRDYGALTETELRRLQASGTRDEVNRAAEEVARREKAAAAQEPEPEDVGGYSVGDRVVMTNAKDTTTVWTVSGLFPDHYGLRLAEGERGATVSAHNVRRATAEEQGFTIGGHYTTSKAATGVETIRLSDAQRSALEVAGLELEEGEDMAALKAAWDGKNTLTVTDATRAAVASDLNELSNREDGQGQEDGDAEMRKLARRAAKSLATLMTNVGRGGVALNAAGDIVAPAIEQQPDGSQVIKNVKLEQLAEERKAIEAENADLIRQLKDKLKNQTNAGIDPEVVKIAVKLVVNYTKLGIKSFQAAAIRFRADGGAGRAMDRAFEIAWQTVQGGDRPNLATTLATPTAASVKAEADANVAQHRAALVAQYWQQFGDSGVIDNDLAKPLVSPVYAESRANRAQFSGAVQAAAGALTTAVVNEAIRNLTPNDTFSLVAGGPGVGKTEAVQASPAGHITFVSTMQRAGEAERIITAVTAKGAKVVYTLVMRDPAAAWRAVLTRAMGDEGRLPPIAYTAAAMKNAAQAFLSVLEAHPEDPNLVTTVIQDRTPIADQTAQAAAIRAFLEAYNEGDVTAELRRVTDEEFAAQRIDEAVREAAYSGAGTDQRGTSQAVSRPDGREPDSARPPETVGAPDDGTRRPVAGGEGGQSGSDGRGGRSSGGSGRGARAGTRDQAQTESGSGTGTGEGGTLPGPDRNPGLTPQLYTITDADTIGTGSAKERISRNFAAIRVAKQLLAEQRPATPEEQRILVRYVGWGGLSRIFEPWKTGPEGKDNDYWREQYDALKALLSDEEFARARNSTQNAHYTSPTVIRAMWDAVTRLGATRGSVLETSAGIGHFVGLMPAALRGAMTWALVEKDRLTAQIAAALYPGAFTQNTPFEQAQLPNDHFTLAIGNIPFGSIPITDPSFEGPVFIRQRIHNYFFAKALDRLKPGGLVAFVVTRGMLDSRGNTQVRQYLASRADFLGAIRLPYTAFKGNANTEVVTDIVFLRKRHEGAAVAHAGPWTETVAQALPTKTDGETAEHYVNEYFLAHPAMVLGTHTATGKMRHGAAYNVIPRGGTVTETAGQHMTRWADDGAAQLAEAINTLPKHAIDLTPPKSTLAAFVNTMPPLGTRPYEYLIHEGRLAQMIDGKIEPVDVGPGDETRIRALLPIREAIRDVYDVMAEPESSDAKLKAAQRRLTAAYDGFVKKYGVISLSKNWQTFREDPDLPLLLSLEDYDDETEQATKTAIFTTRMMEAERQARSADTPQQALHLVLGERGRLDFDRAGELLGVTAEAARDQLHAAGLIIETPSGWQLPAQYLSGNVRVKSAEADAAAKVDGRYAEAAEKLKAVIPADIPAHKINVRLGASWVPVDVVTAFVRSIVGRTDPGAHFEWQITYSPLNALWSIEGSPTAHSSTYQTSSVDTKKMLLAALNDRRITVKTPPTKDVPSRVDKEATALARQKREELHQAFAEWLFNDTPDRREWAIRTYNDRFNAHVAPTVDGSYLLFPGMATYWRDRIRPHQRNLVARVLQFGNTLAAHVVGAGKTLELAAAGMELRRMGLARKPLYVVPNHLISQWPSEFLQYYPNARILIARPEDLERENRRRFTARIASGDWDAVIMPYSAFVRVSMSPEAEAAYHREMLDAIEQAILEAEYADAQGDSGTVVRGGRRSSNRKSPTVKNLENMRDRIQAKLDKLADRAKDDMLSFEQLGVDALFVDEAHSFKNLYFHTRQQAAGIPADNDAQRATDLFLKARYVNKLSNYRNVVLATGTPVSNSMAEIFVMQKLLQEQTLRQAGIDTFDAWLAQFGLITVETELDPSGTGMSQRARLAKYRNLGRLAELFRQVTDVKTIDDLPDLKDARPKLVGDTADVIAVPATDEQLAYLHELNDRAEHLDPKRRDLDNMAKITVDGRMAMLDMRLIDRRRPDNADSKLHRVAQEVSAIYHEYKDRKGTQLIFMDGGTPGAEARSSAMKEFFNIATGRREKRPPTDAEKHRGLDLYADLKTKLVARGIPAAQIAFIHDVDDAPPKKRDAVRKALFRKVKEGQIRVLIGSSNKMGTGMNVQDRLVAEHNVDPTYKPSETEQRYGRILRQGNEFFNADRNFRVRILNYVTQGRGQNFGFDAYMWQLNEAKAKFIADFFKADVSDATTGLDLDQTVLTASEMKAVATGNPLVLELSKAEAEADRLRLVRRGYEEQVREATWSKSNYDSGLRSEQEALTKWERTVADIGAKPERPTIAVGKAKDQTEIVGQTEVGDAIIAAAQKHTHATAAHPAFLTQWSSPVQIGAMRGFHLWLRGSKSGNPVIEVRHPKDAPPRYGGEGSEYMRVNPPVDLLVPTADASAAGGLEWRSGEAVGREVNHVFNRMASNVEHHRSNITYYTDKLDAFTKILSSGFAQQAEYDRAIARVEDLRRRLGVGQEDTVQQPGDGEDEADGGSDNASLGDYAEVAGDEADGGDGEEGDGEGHYEEPRGEGPPQRPSTRGFRRIEFPELIELAKELIGNLEIVKRFRKDGKHGEFRAGPGAHGVIRLHADLFKFGMEHQLAATLAHEIGHLIDWLPNHVLKRGNILGRLQTLRNFLKGKYTAQDGTTIANPEVRAELIALSGLWRPWNPERSSASYNTYRRSAKELYADALSVLLNNPGLLEEKAPIFFKEFFAELDKKPDVKGAYFALQAVLGGTREEVVDRRVAGDRAMLESGDTLAMEIERRRAAEAKAARKDLWFRFKVQWADKHYPFIDRIAALVKRGITINPDDNPRFFLEERNYLGGKLKAWLERHIQPAYEGLDEAGIDWHTFGQALYYERIIAGDRSEMANQNIHGPEDAAERYERLTREMTTDQKEALASAISVFRAGFKTVQDAAYQAGLYSDDLYEQMGKNPAYVSFRVIEYLEKHVTSKVYHQIGTIKDITNPADATILKALVTIRAIEHQIVKQKAFAFLHAHFPGDIEDALETGSGKYRKVVEPTDRTQRLVTYYVKGQLKGKYVDDYIADSLENVSVGQNNAIVRLLQLTNSRVFRPLFTTVNLGFQSFNLVRDFLRMWKNVPGMTLGKAIRLYWQSVPLARVRAYGLNEKPTADELKAYEQLLQAEEIGLFSITFNQYALGRDVEDTQIEDILTHSGIGAYQKPEARPVIKQLKGLVSIVTELGDFIETLPKAAAIHEYRGEGDVSSIPPQTRSYIRRKVGSPDFLAGGTYKPWSNNVFLFSNAITHAWIADMEVARDRTPAQWGMAKTVGAAWWWKTAAVNLLPKVLMFGAMLGAYGAAGGGDDDDDPLKRMMRRVTEYDKTNYLIVPLGETEGQTIYLRLPQDDTGRFIGGVFWKMLRLGMGQRDIWQTITTVLDYGAGVFPSVSPTISAAGNTIEYGSGRNPYDKYRGRFVLSDDEQKARDWHTTGKFVGWEFQQLGAGVVWKFYPGEQAPRHETEGQKILELPVVSNIVGRFVRITNYGETERLREVEADIGRDEARQRRTEDAAINRKLGAYLELPAAQQTRATQHRMAVDLAQELYGTDRRERADREDTLARKFRLGIVRGKADALATAVLSARSTDQRVAIILEAKDTMPAAQYQRWLSTAAQEHVISPAVLAAVRRKMRH